MCAAAIAQGIPIFKNINIMTSKNILKFVRQKKNFYLYQTYEKYTGKIATSPEEPISI